MLPLELTKDLGRYTALDEIALVSLEGTALLSDIKKHHTFAPTRVVVAWFLGATSHAATPDGLIVYSKGQTRKYVIRDTHTNYVMLSEMVREIHRIRYCRTQPQ